VLYEEISQINPQISLGSATVFSNEEGHWGTISVLLLNDYELKRQDYIDIIRIFVEYQAKKRIIVNGVRFYDSQNKKEYFLDDNENLISSYLDFGSSTYSDPDVHEEPVIVHFRPLPAEINDLLPFDFPELEQAQADMPLDELDPDTTYIKMTDHFHYRGGGGCIIEGTDLPPEYGGPDPQK